MNNTKDELIKLFNQQANQTNLMKERINMY